MKDTLFDRWAAPLASTYPLKDLQDPYLAGRPLKIGIDAEHYLFKFAGKEPLNGALGGDPLSLEDKVMTELNELKKLNCEMIFYFHGCDYPVLQDNNRQGGDRFIASNKAAEINSAAFSKYEEAQPKEAIEIFKGNDFSDMTGPLAWLKAVLEKHSVPFLTAPFSAYAQMVAAFKDSVIDMYYASSELFLFEVGQLITSIDIKVENSKAFDEYNNEVTISHPDIKGSTFRLLDFGALCSSYIRGPDGKEAIARDAMFLSGSSRLPVFPPWAEAASNSPFNFANAVEWLLRCDGSVYDMVQQAPNISSAAKQDYWDHYMQIVTAVQHMAVLETINEIKVTSQDGKPPPSDLHLALGLHLPDELNYYMATGIISPKPLNWLHSGRMTIVAPFSGGDDMYKVVIKNTLQPWRRQTYAVLAAQLNRYFQKRPVTTEYWFQPKETDTFKSEDDSMDQKPLSRWRVQDTAIAKKSSELNVEAQSLLFAVCSLKDSDFASGTIGEKSAKEWDSEQLASADELVCNTIWRTLFLRGYISEEHELTPWGRVALSALEVAGQVKEQEEAVFVAVEMMRAGHLSPTKLLTQRSSKDKHKQYTEFVAKVASVGQMVHMPKGYSGPLNHQLLSFHNSVSAVRTALRELTEATMCNLFLCGDGKRIRDDYTQLARDIPFQGRFSCGLGIMISTYLDEYNNRVKAPIPSNINDQIKQRLKMYCAHAQIQPSMDRAVQIWDAVMTAVRAAADLVGKEDRQKYEEIDKWFAGRRPDTKDPVLPDIA